MKSTAATRPLSKRRASSEASSSILAINLQMKVAGNGSPFPRSTTDEKKSRERSSRKRQSVTLFDASPKRKKASSKSTEVFTPEYSTNPKSKQTDLKCTCYNPPVCPLHNLPSKSLISPFIAFQNTPFSCTSQVSMAVDNFAVQCGSSQSVSVPAIFQGHLLIPQHFANSLEKSIAAQQPVSPDCLMLKETWQEKQNYSRTKCSCANKPSVCVDLTDHPEEPHPPEPFAKVPEEYHPATPSAEAKCETKNVPLESSQCAQSSNWLAIGKSSKRWVYFNNDEKPLRRQCYNAIRHKTETDSIQLRDCVIVNSENSQKLFIGKIAEFFQDPKTKTLWASLMWFYWPEQTELDGQELWHSKEIFASRHLDNVPVDSIQDVAYVLTFNEYNRYIAENLNEQLWPPRPSVVPRAMGTYHRRRLMPTEDMEESNVFFCRNVYEFQKKRLITETN